MSKYKQLKQKLINSSNLNNPDKTNSIINININSASDIISPYSEDNKVVINSEFATFLDNSVKDVSPKNDLSIAISAKNCNIDLVSTAIKNYYYNECIDTERKLKRNLVASIITLIIGLIALSSTIILNAVNTPIIIGSSLDIFAWVFMWEAIDLFFFRRAELKYIQYRQLNFINATIIKN